MRDDYENLLGEVREAEVANICSALIRFKSINPPGNERGAAEYVGHILSKAGFAVQLVPQTAERASLVARLKGTGEVPALLYSGHLDVAPLGTETWKHDPFSGEISNGRVWGRGASDMKGGNAAIMVAAKILASAGHRLRGDLILCFSAGEESGFTGARDIMSQCELGPVQALFMAEPTDNRVIIAEKGMLWLEITTHGKAIHIAYIEQGRNAVVMMLDVLSHLDELDYPYEEHPLLGHFVWSINTVHGGSKINTIPDQCVATVDMRTVPGQDHTAIVAQVEELLTRLSHDRSLPGFRATLQLLLDAPPLETPADDPALQRFCEVVTEVTGRRPVPQGVGAGTDAVVFVPRLKVPFVQCGPGNPNLVHHTDECVEISKLVEATKIYLLTAVRFLT